MGKKLGTTRSLTRGNIAKTPDRTGIYVLKNEQGATQYVGKSQQLKTRLTQHLSQKDIPGARSFQTRTLTSKKQADNLEGRYIQRLKPKYNVLKNK